MRSTTSLSIVFSMFFSLILFSCDNENDFTDQSHLSEKILGKWVQVQSFDLVDPNTNPTAWTWNDVEAGFTLELLKDNRFIYSVYGTCATGSYRFNPTLQKIDFEFDCPIEIFGEMSQTLTEYFDMNFIQNQRIILEHASNSQTQKQAMSMLEKVR